MNSFLFDPPSDPYGNEKHCYYCDWVLSMSSWGDWTCTNPDCETNFTGDVNNNWEDEYEIPDYGFGPYGRPM